MKAQDEWYGASEKAQKRIRGTKKAGNIAFSVGRAIFLFSLCLVLLYPILIMASIAFRNPIELYDPTVVWIPKSFTFSAFIHAYQALGLADAFLQTAGIAGMGTVCQLAACMMAGYGMARYKYPGKNLAFGLLVLTIIVPPQVVTIPSMVYFQNFDFFGVGKLIGLFTTTPVTVSLRNSVWAYFLPALLGCGIKSGLFIFIFLQFFRNLPNELQDAAAIDGCGRFQTFWRIMLPLSGAAILTVTLFSLVWYWNDSYYGVVHFDRLQTLSVLLQSVKSDLYGLYAGSGGNALDVIPQVQAAALMSVAPLLVLYAVLQKYFTESIERTGIVG